MEYTMESWANDHVLYVHLDGDMTLDDWARISDEMCAWIDAQPHSVHVIVDTSNVGNHPYNAVQFQKATTWASLNNLGWTVLLSENRLVNILATTTLEFFGKNFQQADSVEDAVNFLTAEDSTLNPQ